MLRDEIASVCNIEARRVSFIAPPSLVSGWILVTPCVSLEQDLAVRAVCEQYEALPYERYDE
jgi:hypothetical protein